MLQTIEMREIRVFLTLAEELHFGRTAERLGLTQSRVSQSLRALETKLGVQLFQRTSRRVVLTSAGERWLGEVAPAYEQLLGTLQRAAPAPMVEGVLRLGVIAAAAVPSNLLRVIDEFEARHPGSRVNVVELPFRGRHDPLRRGDVDLMVTRLPLTDRDLVIGPVVSQEMRMVAVARDHPLGSHGTVSLEDIADHAVFDMSALIPNEMADAFVPLTTPSGRPIRRLRIPAEDLSELVILIARGRIAHLTVASAAPRFAHPNVTCIPCTDVPPSSTALCWRRQAPDRRLRAFVEVANQQLTRVPINCE
jgi:DNA-binding transcriptional LysR family regulator